MVAAIVSAVVIGSAAGRLRANVPSRAASTAPNGNAAVEPSGAPTANASASLAAADTADLVFRQPLSAGCATSSAVYVFSDGGRIGRYDGHAWQPIETTLRTFVAAACDASGALAVGPAGAVAQIDDASRRIALDPPGMDDLFAVSFAPDGTAMLAGAHGIVRRRSPAGDEPYARGIGEDLLAVAAFGPASAWAAGAGGSAYRLEPQGWRPFPTGTTVALRALAGTSPDDVIAAGDAGTLLRFDGAWHELASGTGATLRGAARAAGATWIVGDAGTVLVLDAGANAARRIDLGTACPLRAVFARSGVVWIVGSGGGRAAAWRVDGAQRERWGDC